MRVIKSYNNSIVLAEDKGRQVVAIGLGCGFGMKTGDRVDESKVTTIFPFTSEELESLNMGLLETLDSRDLAVVKRIVGQVSERLGYKFRSSMVFSLVDHLRNTDPTRLTDEEHPFHWIVIRVYPNEYAMAKWAIHQLAQSELGLAVPESEATAIAIHFINNQDASTIHATMEATEHVHRIVSILEYKLNRTVPRTTLKYSRFVTHLRFLVHRMQHPGLIDDKAPTNLLRSIYDETSDLTHQILDSICEYLQEAFHREVDETEQGYLLIYLNDFTAELNSMPG